MPYSFTFPDVGEGITEGEIVKWRVKEGDSVKADQLVVDVETDKAVVNLPSPRAGKVLKIGVQEGETVKVGQVLMVIGEQGEKASIARAAAPPVAVHTGEMPRKSVGVVGELEEAPPEDEETGTARAVIGTATSKEILAIPLVRKYAQDAGVDLSSVKGTGAGGRITKEDVEAAVGKAGTVVHDGASGAEGERKDAIKVTRKYDLFGYVERAPLKGMRKAIAKHMREAVSQAAYVTHMDEFDVTHLAEMREKEKKKWEKKGVHITYLPFVIKALVAALKEHPMLNASVETAEGNEEIVVKKYYNIGVAVATSDGLIVPVIKGAEQKKIVDLAREIEELAKKAEKRKLDLMDLKGGTFTITNIGVLGGTHFTPIPNHPEAAILGLGKIAEKPVVRGRKIVVRKIMPVSITFDHRVLDGADCARFANTLKEYLERQNSTYHLID